MARKKRTTITEEIITRICELYRDGMSQQEITKELDLGQGTVSKYLKLNNIDTSYIKKDVGTEIIQKYIDGATPKKLSKEYGYAETTISKYLKDNNVDYRGVYKFNSKEKEQICEDYKNGLSEEKLADKYNSNRTTIRNVLKACGVARRNQSEYRRYSLNEHYFDEIDVPNKAYLLGLLYADGNVATNNYTIQIGLQSRDVDILNRMKEELESNYPLYFNEKSKREPNHQDVYSFSIQSKHMHESLCKLGVVPRKTLIITYPDFLPEELHKHFLRGALDGDGCINKPYGKNGKCRIAYICGTSMFCEGVKEVVERQLGIHVSLIKNKNIKKATISGRLQVKKFLDWLYEDADLKLDRKYQLYLKYYCNNGLEEIA